ncbi:MAG TPA: ATP-binding protein [Candidatus Onthocola stercoravium]|nr:ATP-binding protein [Candidatus Onthocola stercoravium]
MFGKVLRIDNNELTIENLGKKALSSLMNVHVVFEDETRKIIGEIIFIDETVIKILLVGEIVNNTFISGVIKKPSGITNIRIVTFPELELIFGKNQLNKDNLLLGRSAIYNNLNISVPLNSFFANHSAIIGNTGSGKSCGLARILQNLFLVNPQKPVNAHIVLFDAYGEYVNAFQELNSNGFKTINYTTKIEKEGERQLSFPAYFLDVDDLAILLQVQSSEQIPVLTKALKLVTIFKSNNPLMKEYKNDIIANCLLDILTSGRSSSHIRDQIIAVLSHYNTETLNLDAIIHQPGYDRTFRQCLLIDEQGKMNAIFEVVKFLQNFEKVNLDNLKVTTDFAYTLDDLYYALEFALISEGVINSNTSYEQNNILKNRLQSIINSNEKEIFKFDEYISKETFVETMFNGVQLININLDNLDDRFAKIITKLYSKLLFNYTTSRNPRGKFSVNIVLEEAHRYVQNDNDINIIGYNIFDRITKEGRKYGTLLTFITQRPSELSTTALSQCANYIVFRVFHPEDLNIVRSMSTNVSSETLEQIKGLNPGTAFCFGTGFKIPTLVMFTLPRPLPESTSLKISELWY